MSITQLYMRLTKMPITQLYIIVSIFVVTILFLSYLFFKRKHKKEKKYALLLLRFQAILLQKDKICSWEERDKKRGG